MKIEVFKNLVFIYRSFGEKNLIFWGLKRYKRVGREISFFYNIKINSILFSKNKRINERDTS
jgi:hypothetical protein